MFTPPLNMGQFQPSPATMSQWIYQIWKFLQENPIATETEIREFIQSELVQSETLANAIEDYLTENPPEAPVQSVQGKTGAVTLAYSDIVPASNAVPVYKAASTPTANTLTGQYNIGYRLFVNTTTQEIFTISPAGALSLVGRGKFDGTTVDVNSAQGDTTISEAITEINNNITSINGNLHDLIIRREYNEQVPDSIVSQGEYHTTFTAPTVAGYKFIFAAASLGYTTNYAYGYCTLSFQYYTSDGTITYSVVNGGSNSVQPRVRINMLYIRDV